jgi:beta-mannosidase
VKKEEMFIFVLHFFQFNLSVEYLKDCVDVNNYLSPRFASEYGWQGFPSMKSLKNVSLPGDLVYNSKFVNHRQHHKDGNDQLLKQIKRHFRDPSGSNPEIEFEDFVYLTQCVQTLCIKSQTEHYRRGSGTKAHTMGALYWQYNDIWQAPTWASVEHSGEWKMLHYHAKNFFNQFLISAFTKFDTIHVHLTNDLPSSIQNINVQLQLIDFKEGRTQWGQQLSNISIDKITSKEVFKIHKNELIRLSNCKSPNECFLTISAKSGNHSSENVHFLTPLRTSTLLPVEFKVLNIQQIDKNTFKFEIVASNVSPFTFLESSNFGRFSDNGFMLLKNMRKTLFYYGWSDIQQFESSIKIKSMNSK